MKNNPDIDIYINYEEYNLLFTNKSKQIAIKANFDNVILPENLIKIFIDDDFYYESLEEALKKRININFILVQNDEILLKNTYSPLSIILGISTQEKVSIEFKYKFNLLLNKINFKNYINRNKSKIFKFELENKSKEITYENITSLIFNELNYKDFVSSKSKYDGYSKEEFVYILKEFMLSEKILQSFQLDNSALLLYSFLIDYYDTESINKYLVSIFKYHNNVSINANFEKKILSTIPTNISLVEKTIYLYLNLVCTLKYDFEFIDDVSNIKKHKDLTRISEIDIHNNKVVSYEFSCLFAIFLEKLNIKFEYNDKYIIARIGKFILKYKSITSEFNSNLLSQIYILNGISLVNKNKNTKEEFSRTTKKIIDNLYQKRIDLEIMKMPFNRLLMNYKKESNKISIDFQEKYDIFYKLISNVYSFEDPISYIYAIKAIIFNECDFNANISFATVAELNNNVINPVVIVTINFVNMNLYNSNKYIYYNPPYPIKIYSLNELRLDFFHGKFKYISGNKDNIIGLEKSNI